MTQRPTSDPTWATGATPNVLEPAAARPDGYPDGFVPPAEFHNWQFETIGDWIAFLDSSGGRYTSLGAAIDALEEGDTATIVSQLDLNSSPRLRGEFMETFDLTPTAAVSAGVVDSDGKHMLVVNQKLGPADDVVELRDREDLTTVLQTFSPTIAAGNTIFSARTNGKYVVAVSDEQVDIWTIDGASVATIALAANDIPVDVALCRGRAIVAVNNAVGLTYPVKTFDLATGAQVGVDFDITVPAHEVKADDFQAYVLHDDSGGNFVSAISPGTGINSWQWNPSGGFTAPGAGLSSWMHATRDGLFVYNDATLIYHVLRNGAEVRTSNAITQLAAAGRFAGDDKFIYFNNGLDLYTIDWKTLELAYVQPSAINTSISYITSDGDGIFYSENTVFISRRKVGRSGDTWTLVDPDNSPMQQLIIPPLS